MNANNTNGPEVLGPNDGKWLNNWKHSALKMPSGWESTPRCI